MASARLLGFIRGLAAKSAATWPRPGRDLGDTLALRPNRGVAQDGSPIKATTTTGMIADLALNIGGDRVEVSSLMDPGVDPHLYKPSAGDIRKLEDADLILYNGLELEGRMTDLLVKIARSGKPTIPVAEEIPEDLLREPPQLQGKYDPHIWFDVTLWKVAAQRVKDALTEVEPGSDAVFQANLDAYLAEVLHLLNHDRGPDHEVESSIEYLREGLRWTVDRTATAVDGAMRRGWIERANGHLDLTDQGRQAAVAVLAR